MALFIKLLKKTDAFLVLNKLIYIGEFAAFFSKCLPDIGLVLAMDKHSTDVAKKYD